MRMVIIHSWHIIYNLWGWEGAYLGSLVWLLYHGYPISFPALYLQIGTEFISVSESNNDQNPLLFLEESCIFCRKTKKQRTLHFQKKKKKILPFARKKADYTRKCFLPFLPVLLVKYLVSAIKNFISDLILPSVTFPK